MLEEVDITKARCVYCGRRVDACVGFEALFSSDGKGEVYNRIYTYWSCNSHGAVPAEIDGKYVEKPSDLFKELKFVDWGVAIKRRGRRADEL